MSDRPERHYPSLIPKEPRREDADDDTVVLPVDNTMSCLCGHDPHAGPCRALRCKCPDYRPVGFADLALDPDDPALVAMRRLYDLERVPDEVVEVAKQAFERVNQLAEEGQAMSQAIDPTDPGAVAVPEAPSSPEAAERSPALERAMARVRETSAASELVDDELTAMQRIVSALDRLDDGARTRVITWAWARYG